MQVLTDGPLKTYLFRLKFNTLEEALRVAEPASIVFSGAFYSTLARLLSHMRSCRVKQAHANSNSYRPSRRQENGGPEPMDLCHAGARALVLTTTRSCKNAIDVRRQGILHTNAVPRARYHVPQETVTAKRPSEVKAWVRRCCESATT